jgi:proteasome alpha subunit
MDNRTEYDRAITMFSPDGRLLQVEYAKKTVKQGSLAIGICYDDGVLILAEKKAIDPLVDLSAIEKIAIIDDHLIATASGIISDARILFDIARVKAQQHRVNYGNEIDTISIVKELANIQQYYTQSGGYRPFGISALIAGYDLKPSLYVTDPIGIFIKYFATAIGREEEKVKEMLKKEYSSKWLSEDKSLTKEDAIKLGLKCMKETIKDLKIENIDVSFIESNKVSQTLQLEDIKKYF